jgi:anti-sigma regulatory factor (Ser/Thr protein kinase)
MIALLQDRVAPQLAGAAELIVSELVTNSVIHARMGPTNAIAIDVELADDRLRIAVMDDGAECLPHRVDPDPSRPGGMGLLLVERLSAAWGVDRERSGVTRVWCELVVDVS